MTRRPKARLITGDFDLHDVSFRTQIRAPKSSTHDRQRVPPIGSPTRNAILSSKRLWQECKPEHSLLPDAEAALGHAIHLTQITVKRELGASCASASVSRLKRRR